jgi:hypothetical protein
MALEKDKALTAHLHEIPRIFHSPAGKVGCLDSTDTHLSKVPSYKHWSHGAHCLKRKIETELVKVRYANRIIIQRHFKPGMVAYSIVMEALDKSVTWATGLVSFIDRMYESLHAGSKFTATQAWSLTSQLVRRIFADLHTAMPEPRFFHLKSTDLYPVEGSDLAVVFPTHSSFTNWGRRWLNNKKIVYAMDLPVWLVTDEKKLMAWMARFETRQIMPLKPLQVILKLLLDSYFKKLRDHCLLHDDITDVALRSRVLR